MREILFRAKRIKDGKWAEGYLSQTTIVGEAPARLALIITEETEKVYDHYRYEIDPDTVGQFTGVSDKDGAKIFEGDIVKQFFDFGLEITAEAVFREGAFGLSARRGGTTEFTPFANICNCAFEVSGNIFDNPELVGKD